jgi:hypothetical protein
VEEPLVTNYFSQALDIMSQAITSSQPAGTPIPLPPALQGADVNYFQLMERRRLLEATEKRLEELRRGDFPRQYASSAHDNSAGHHTASIPVHRGSYDVSFKEVVEEFAARNSVTFTPKLDNSGQVMIADGKPLWRFADKISCYIDQNVVFVRKASTAVEGVGKVTWTPVSLETLLELSKFA